MSRLNDNQLRSVAYQLLKAKNQKAGFQLSKRRITSEQFLDFNRKELALIGFTHEEIKIIKNELLDLAGPELLRASHSHIEIFFRGTEYYPALLEEIYDPPEFIYVKGDKTVLKKQQLAVVGSRRAGTYGEAVLKSILPDVVRCGFAVVSGMAYGVDSMAHLTAIASKGKTVGVNAGGLLKPYPAGNRLLIDKIVKNGCIISEFPLEVVPRPHLFPVRNRIIAGIARGILVVEAEMRSGSLITARLGLEQNREIFAVPGRIDSPLSVGCHYLIQQGAKLVSCARDILGEYDIQLPREGKRSEESFSKKEWQILDLMEDYELKSIDYLAEHLDLSISDIISTLMGLVLKQKVVQEGEGYKRLA